MSDTVTTTTFACACCGSVPLACTPEYMASLPATIAMTIGGLVGTTGGACVTTFNRTVVLTYTAAMLGLGGGAGWEYVEDCTGDTDCCGNGHTKRYWQVTCSESVPEGLRWVATIDYPLAGGGAGGNHNAHHDGPTPVGTYPDFAPAGEPSATLSVS